MALSGALRTLILGVCLVFVGVVTSSEVCQDCVCVREGSHYDIRCDCLNQTDLTFSREYMKFREDSSFSDLPTIALSVTGCRTVQFASGLLLIATRVDVRNVTTLEIQADSIVGVGDLEIRKVVAVNILAYAFFTRNVTSLVLEDAFVKTLDEFVLASVNELRRLEIRRVSVQALRSNAVILTMANLSEVILSDTQIFEIERDGLLLTANNMTVVNCSFGSLKDDALQLTSASMFITNNTFQTLEGVNSVSLGGTEAHITNNRFPSFHANLWEKKFRRLELVGNEFRVPINNVSMSKWANFSQYYPHNSFQCECSDDFGWTLSNIHELGYERLLEKTFCVSQNCPRSITHAQLLQQFQGNWSECALNETCVPTSSSSSSPSSGLLVRSYTTITFGRLCLLLLVAAFS